MKTKMIVLGAVMVIALCVGIWFLVSPSINRQADLEQQGDLLDSILAVMPPYSIAETEIEPPVDVFEPTNEVVGEYTTELPADEPYMPYEPYITSEEQEPEPIIDDAPLFEPLNSADFPSSIIPIGILTIDSIDLRLPVKEGVTEPELRVAPGRVPQTAIVGEVGNAVIAGHRNFTFGSMFNRLGEMENGDIIGFQAMTGEVMAFEVFEVLVLNPDDQIAFIQPQNEAIITLYTCTPIREATHRLIVRARKIEGGL